MTREGHDDDGRQEMSSSRTGMLEVQQAVKELETAAWREGIDPEGLLGTFVLAQGRLLVKTAHLLERAEAAIVYWPNMGVSWLCPYFVKPSAWSLCPFT